MITSDKLTSTKIYSILISKVQNKPSSNIYFENLFNDVNMDWATIYKLDIMRSFQYKILKIVLYLNKKLHTFRIEPHNL